MMLRNFLRHSTWLLIAGAALQNQFVGVQADEELTAEAIQADQNSPAEIRHEATALSELPTDGRVVRVAADEPACAQSAATPGCANGACAARPNPNSCGTGVGVARCGPGANPNTCRRMYGHGLHMYPETGYTLRDAGHSMSRTGHATRQTARGWRDPAMGASADWNEWCDECNHRMCNGWCDRCCRWRCDGGQMFLARNRQTSAVLHAHFCGKLAYFTPMGNGGQGVPPIGSYHLVYAANPQYFDQRDAQVYAAQGWAVPMSVPLAPNVRHTMNYSTGIPSSRLTQISTVVPPRPRFCPAPAW